MHSLFAEGSGEGWSKELDCCTAPQDTSESELTVCTEYVALFEYNNCLQIARLCSVVADRQSDSEGEVPSRQQLEPTAEEIENAGMPADLMERVLL